jgi:hypothetical protein
MQKDVSVMDRWRGPRPVPVWYRWSVPAFGVGATGGILAEIFGWPGLVWFAIVTVAVYTVGTIAEWGKLRRLRSVTKNPRAITASGDSSGEGGG